MSTDTEQAPVPIGEISSGPSKAEEFLEKNQKLLLIGAIGIVIAGIAYITMSGLKEKAQAEAGNALMASTDESALSAIITDHPGSNAAGTAHLLIADSLWAADDKSGAIEKLRGFLSTFPDHAARPTAQAKLASFLVRNGQAAEAKPLLEDITSTPEADYVAPFALRLLGDIAVSEGDAESAKSYYSRSAENYGSRFSPRINSLSTLRQGLVDFEEPVEVDPPAPKPTTPPEITSPTGQPIPLTPALPTEPTAPEPIELTIPEQPNLPAEDTAPPAVEVIPPAEVNPPAEITPPAAPEEPSEETPVSSE